MRFVQKAYDHIVELIKYIKVYRLGDNLKKKNLKSSKLCHLNVNCVKQIVINKLLNNYS